MYLFSAVAKVSVNVDVFFPSLMQASWTSDEQGLRTVDRRTLMGILADLSHIFIKSSYDRNQREVRSVRMLFTLLHSSP